MLSNSDDIFFIHKDTYNKKIDFSINFNNVSFSYDKNKPILKNLNFSIKSWGNNRINWTIWTRKNNVNKNTFIFT